MFEGGHGDAGEAAGDDGLEAGEVAGEIQGKAVLGDPAAHADADGGDFSVLDPDAGEALAVIGGGDALGVEEVDLGLLQGAEVTVQVAGIAVEVEDQVADQLAGTVPGGLAATVDLNDGMGQGRGIAEAAAVTGAADGVNGIVLEQQHGIGDFSGLALGDQAVLLGEGCLKADPAEPSKIEVGRGWSGGGWGHEGTGSGRRVNRV